MQFLNKMTRREQTIFYITMIMGVAAIVYFAYLKSFIADYQQISSELKIARNKMQAQTLALKKGDRVDERFMRLAGSLPRPHAGRPPEVVLSEEMENMFRSLRLRTSEFGRTRIEEIPDVDGFAYLILPIQRVEGNLNTITVLLKSLANRNLIVHELRLDKTVGRLGDDTITMDVDVAQVIQTESLSEGGN
ncbi:MAG: hypothetical protein ACLFUS_02110 [Candidatus Sumerlaeia bacterium]